MRGKRKNTKTKRVTSRRSSSSKKVSYLFDQAVPLNLLFHDLLLARAPRSKPTIHRNEYAPASPFVVHLAAELPRVEDVIAEQDRRRVLLNFALPEHELSTPDPSAHKQESLRLTPWETVAQLRENDRTGSQKQPRSRMSGVRLPTLRDIQEAIRAFRVRESIWEPTAEIFDPSRLIPKQPDAHALPFVPFELELPEAEEDEDESDVLTLDELTGASDFRQRTSGASAKVPSSFQRLTSNLQRLTSNLRLPTFELQPGWHRAMAAFVLVSFAFVLPLHAVGTLSELRAARANIEETGARGLQHLGAAASAVFAQNSSRAIQAFSNAENNFATAGQTLEELGASASFLLSVLPDTRKSYQSASHLLASGEQLALAGKHVSDGFALLDTPAALPTTKLNVLSAYLSAALPLLKEAAKHIEEVDPNVVPVSYQSIFDDLQGLLPTFVTSVKNITAFAAMASTLLGDEGRQRYLLVFQNNAEVRPTGGFMGSFARIDLVGGEVQNMEIPGGGSYDLQGSLKTYVAAPKPVQLINARWEFQDTNWFSDFPTSARQILDFYTDAGGPSVDGVIAVNATFVMELLSVLGPINMPEYHRVIDADNFLFETQKIVELEYAAYAREDETRKEEAPKAFIGDLTRKLLERINSLEREELIAILQNVHAGLLRKDLQLYVVNEDLEASIQELGWGGEVKQVEGDYLHIVDTNLGGGKTDGVMEQQVDLTVRVSEEGNIINELIISRTHHGIQNALFTGVNNVDYLRVYVPKGSTLLSAGGFTIPDASLFETPEIGWGEDTDVQSVEAISWIDSASGTQIGEEFGKTVFGNWVQTKPGETSTVTFIYSLPFTMEKLAGPLSLFDTLKAKTGLSPFESYTLTVQKQSGVVDRTTRVRFETPESMRVLWRSVDGDVVESSNDTDVFWAALLERT